MLIVINWWQLFKFKFIFFQSMDEWVLRAPQSYQSVSRPLTDGGWTVIICIYVFIGDNASHLCLFFDNRTTSQVFKHILSNNTRNLTFHLWSLHQLTMLPVYWQIQRVAKREKEWERKKNTWHMATPTSCWLFCLPRVNLCPSVRRW